jgi:hypothetical protein
MDTHAELRRIVEPYVSDETLYRELVVESTTAKLAEAVAEALGAIDAETPPPSTAQLWDGAMGQPPASSLGGRIDQQCCGPRALPHGALQHSLGARRLEDGEQPRGRSQPQFWRGGGCEAEPRLGVGGGTTRALGRPKVARRAASSVCET